ncbi:DUF4180 domain-containing protein [Paenibacillus piri]|uniref:DUF4180 domain-containing protein n=1 Tax=Paenibacillus piri TaxID=2547395 RepID=A0A4R5KNN0_9BACL|nr:DUF4180 domain-containing protein [Paenibacillus piri]TDF96277.1 DUF4180 domain-containing protein [Paenibacillus piri]
MKIVIDQRNDSKVAIVHSEAIIINNVNDALDLMADVHYNNGCSKMILREEQLTGDFFELRTRLAGEILQKYTNYKMKLAIVGDFSGVTSKSLKDFIYECNQGDNVLFKPTEAEALDRLHRIAI